MTTTQMDSATQLDFETLLDQARQGEKDAQGELLDRFRGFLEVLSARQMDVRLGGRIDPCDVVHETYVAALRSFHQFQGQRQGEFLAWLRTVHDHVVQNLARRHIVAKKRSVKSESPSANSHLQQLAVILDSTPSGKMMRGELIMKLVLALDTLPEDQREAVRLRYCESLPLEQIAQQMERSTQSIAGLLKRGLQALRARMGADLP